MAVPGSRRHRAMVRFSAEPVRATRSLPPPHLAWRSLTPQALFLKLAEAQIKQHTQQETSSTPLPQTPFPNSASAQEDLFSVLSMEYRAGWRPPPSPPASHIQRAMLPTRASFHSRKHTAQRRLAR